MRSSGESPAAQLGGQLRPTLLGVMLGSADGLQMAPMLWCADRTRVPSGIAVTTWLINVVEFALWWADGVLTEDPGIVVLAVVGLASSLAIIARWCWTRDRFAGSASSAADSVAVPCALDRPDHLHPAHV